MLPDFNRLRVFQCIFEEKSLQAAAVRLHVTRSAVSQALKALEEEIGEPLFARHAKLLAPTAAGEALATVVGPFTRQVEETVRGFATGRAAPRGLLRIGAPQELGTGRLVASCARFRAAHPEVRFEITLGVPPTLLEGVAKGTLDLAFVDNADEHDGTFPVALTPLTKETFVLAASRAYYDEHIKRDHSYAHLAAQTFVTYVPTAPVVRMWFKHHFKKAPQTVAQALSVESVHGVLNGVVAGMGLGVVPAHMLAPALAAKKVRLIEGSKRPFVNEIGLATSRHRAPTAAEAAFAAHVGRKDELGGSRG